MELEEKAEELLERLWIQTEENKEGSLSLDNLKATEKEAMEQLLKAGFISVSDSGIMLTDKGQFPARNVVRRHRLAERLLVDVLGTGDRLMDERACKFEHLLDRGLDESICSLLGHPKVCPHGRPIPPGRCCQQEQDRTQKLVSPLSQLAPGQKGKVAYIFATESTKLQKLIALGIHPGAPITLVQSFPSYVFQADQTQFAVDKEIADAIYIRLIEEEPAPYTEKEPPRRHKWRWGKLAPRFGLWQSKRR